MSWLVGFISFLVLADAFDAKHFGVRQQWETGIGVFLVLVALIMYVVEAKSGD